MAEGFLQVLGLMRWSYPSEVTAFEREAESLADLRAQLYAADRLEERLVYLEHVALPCLRAQTDENFRLVLLMGNGLPEPYRRRVLALTSGVEQILPVFEPEGQSHRHVCRKVMQAHRHPRASAVAEFRLDDDDAMALDFVAELRRIYRQCKPLTARMKAYCIDFPRGVALHTGGGPAALSPIFAQHVGIAQALIYKPDHPRSLLDYPHRKLWMAMPTFTFPDRAKWVRGIHATNDSGIAQSVAKLPRWKCDPALLPALLAEEFGLDWAVLCRAFAQLPPRDQP